MQDISIDREQVNVELLDSELKAALPGLVHGISSGRGKVVVHLDNDATNVQIANATQIVFGHDENRLTADQQKKLQREIDIAAGRIAHDEPFDTKTITLEELATRIAWLEQEIRDLRGL
jgi:hypothetical protein